MTKQSVAGPGGYLVKDFADGWYWTPNAALDHAGGAPVWSVSDARYETDPPALSTREEAPDWTARTEAAWAENNREEAPADRAHPCYDEHQPGCDCVIPAQKATPVPSFLERMTAPAEAGERDYPAEFEAWWATYRHRNRDVADYSVKKQIAFDAFYHAALRAQPPAREDAQPVASFWFDPRDPEVTDTNPDNILIHYYVPFDVTMIQCEDMAMFGFWFTPADGSEFQFRYFSDRDQADAEALAQEASIKADGKPDAWLHRSKTSVAAYLTPGAQKAGVLVQPLYTHPHPAPDALRAAMEALEPFAAHPDFHAGDDWPVTFVNDEERAPGVTAGDFRRARQALAALQTEQKGGAA